MKYWSQVWALAVSLWLIAWCWTDANTKVPTAQQVSSVSWNVQQVLDWKTKVAKQSDWKPASEAVATTADWVLCDFDEAMDSWENRETCLNKISFQIEKLWIPWYNLETIKTALTDHTKYYDLEAIVAVADDFPPEYFDNMGNFLPKADSWEKAVRLNITWNEKGEALKAENILAVEEAFK